MSLTSAMQVGFTGIQSNSVGVDTVGDNLANANTTAFKGQRTLFETLLYKNIQEGDAARWRDRRHAAAPGGARVPRWPPCREASNREPSSRPATRRTWRSTARASSF